MKVKPQRDAHKRQHTLTNACDPRREWSLAFAVILHKTNRVMFRSSHNRYRVLRCNWVKWNAPFVELLYLRKAAIEYGYSRELRNLIEELWFRSFLLFNIMTISWIDHSMAVNVSNRIEYSKNKKRIFTIATQFPRRIGSVEWTHRSSLDCFHRITITEAAPNWRFDSGNSRQYIFHCVKPFWQNNFSYFFSICFEQETAKCDSTKCSYWHSCTFRRR